MKSLIIIAFIVVSVTGIHSQSKQLLSAALYTGGFFPVKGFIDNPNTGFNIGADLEAKNKGFGMYANFTYNFTKEKLNTEVNSERKSIGWMELYMGPRWFIGKGRINGIIDGGLGYYRELINGFGEGFFGINVGTGLNYELSKNFNLTLKGKVHIVNVDYFSLYAGLYLGLRYFFNK